MASRALSESKGYTGVSYYTENAKNDATEKSNAVFWPNFRKHYSGVPIAHQTRKNVSHISQICRRNLAIKPNVSKNPGLMSYT